MELDYRTSLTFTSRYDRDPNTEFRGLLYEWLRGKNLDADTLDFGVTQFNPSTVGTLARVDQRDGSIIERFRLTEVRPNTGGTQTWQTEILAYESSDGVGEVLVHVNDPRENTPGNRPGPTGVPKFVRLLLETTAARDGLMFLGNEPRILDEHDEQLVHDLIVDDTRRLPLVLAPTPRGASVDQFTRDVREMTFGMAGQAGVFVLSPSLVPLLEGRTGNLWLPPGGMRLIPPGTDPATRASAAKSYYVMADRIAERGLKRVGRHWTWQAREHGNNQPWPRHMQRIMRTITEHERDVLLKDLDDFVKARTHTRPNQKPAVPREDTEQVIANVYSAPEETLETLGSSRGPGVGGELEMEPAPVIDEVAVSDVGVDVEEQVRHALIAALPDRDIIDEILQVGGGVTVIESLEFALLLAGDYDSMHAQLEAKVDAVTSGFQTSESSDEYFEQALELQERVQRLEADLEEAESRLDREAGAAQWLRRQLIEVGQAESAWAAPHEVDLAQDFDSVVEVVHELAFVEFTGNESITQDLNEMRGSQAAAKKTHRALLALNDYARAKADGAWASGGFSEYLSDAPAGYATISKSILAPKESEDVAKNPKFRKPRELPMPKGQIVFMEAHIKLSAEATTSPRLHYFDDTAESGKIVVGYIGAHLPNAQT